MRERILDNLTEAQDAMAEEDYERAEFILGRLEAYKLNDYERSAVMQTMGFLKIRQDKLAEAIPAFEESVRIGRLSEEMNNNMVYMLAQLYGTTAQWAKVIDALERWLPTQENPPREAYTLGAQAAASLERYRLAIDFVKGAIDAAPDPGKELFELWMALHFQLGEKREAANVLEKAIVLFPDEARFWRTLSQLYLNLEDEAKAAATMEIAYDKGFIEDGEQLLQLGRLLMFSGAAYKGGAVLQQGLDRGKIPPTAENWELLSNAWLVARELDKSLAALENAAKLSDSAELDMRVGQIYIEQERYAEAARRLESATEKEGVEDRGKLYQLLGYAYYGMEAYPDALVAFRRAAEFPGIAESAQQWIMHIEEEYLPGETAQPKETATTAEASVSE
ncbi:MAG: tetratricopeptide repeat protein [Opitutales bacterium]